MKLLLLAGTEDARRLADRLAGDRRITAVAALTGATRTPAPYPVPVRRGRFGGEGGFEKYLDSNGFGAIIDATHPFAKVMPHRAQAACARRGLRYLRLLRPAWVPGDGDRWTLVADAAAAASAVAAGARVFLATGPRSLDRFAALAEGRHLIVRAIDPPDAAFPYPRGGWITGRPPFTVEAEITMLRAHRIEVVVAKNSGGPARAKLEAARALDLPVVLIDRPAPPPGDRVESVEAACAWLEHRG